MFVSDTIYMFSLPLCFAALPLYRRCFEETDAGMCVLSLSLPISLSPHLSPSPPSHTHRDTRHTLSASTFDLSGALPQVRGWSVGACLKLMRTPVWNPCTKVVWART